MLQNTNGIVDPSHGVRARGPQDDAAIAALNDAAFGGSYESHLVGDLRAARLAAIELAASREQAIVGHILVSEAPFHGEAFMALELVASALAGRGRVIYPPAFGV
jgi:predicted N-acetyltransferase YhbS